MSYIEPVEFASLGLLSVTFASISSPDEDMRKLGYVALDKFNSALEVPNLLSDYTEKFLYLICCNSCCISAIKVKLLMFFIYYLLSFTIRIKLSLKEKAQKLFSFLHSQKVLKFVKIGAIFYCSKILSDTLCGCSSLLISDKLKSCLQKCQKKKDVVRLRLLLKYMQNGIEEQWQRIPSIIALFAAEAALILLDPSNNNYTTISKHLSNSPSVNIKVLRS